MSLHVVIISGMAYLNSSRTAKSVRVEENKIFSPRCGLKFGFAHRRYSVSQSLCVLFDLTQALSVSVCLSCPLLPPQEEQSKIGRIRTTMTVGDAAQSYEGDACGGQGDGEDSGDGRADTDG